MVEVELGVALNGVIEDGADVDVVDEVPNVDSKYMCILFYIIIEDYADSFFFRASNLLKDKFAYIFFPCIFGKSIQK